MVLIAWLLWGSLFFMGACTPKGNSQGQTLSLEKTEGYIFIADHQIYYETIGEGQPIIFLHGGYLNLKMWAEQMEFFAAKGFRVIAFDDLGHGKTKDGKVEVLAHEVLQTLMDSLGIEQAHLVGLSWGAMMAVDFCLEHPERVQKMVLTSPGLNGWEYFQDTLAAANNQLRQTAKAQADTTAFVELFMRNWTDGPAQKSNRLPLEIRQHIQSLMAETVTQHWNKNWSYLLQNPPARQRLSEIKQSVLLIQGELDAVDIHQIIEVYQENLPNVYRLDVPNVAHTLNLEAGEVFNAMVLGFLESK